MSEIFLKLVKSEETDYLLFNHPNAFLLLTLIAKRAKRESGECQIGDYKSCGLTEKKYRRAKQILIERKHIEIIETCRTRKKAEFRKREKRAISRATERATERATVGTLVKLCSSTVYDINCKDEGDRKGDRKGEEQEVIKGKDKEYTPLTPQPKNAVCVVSECVIFPSLSAVAIDEAEKIAISARYSEAVVNNAVQAITAKGFKPSGSLVQALRAACRDKWQPKPTLEADAHVNRKLSQFLERKGHTHYTFIASSTKLEIVKGVNGGSISLDYEQTKEEFRRKIEDEAKIKIG
jgi:hypothetical protein